MEGSTFYKRNWLFASTLLFIFLGISCSKNNKEDLPFVITDKDLSLELITEDPVIVTPIGIAIDNKDALYVLESHTHTPQNDYKGPKFDRIKKSTDENNDGIPEGWEIYADSIEDGMNLAFDKDNVLYLTTKDAVYSFKDHDDDGKSDTRDTLAQMVLPKNVYDHAGILGVVTSTDGYLYFSRGNVAGNHWRIRGKDGTEIEGYGDGGNIMRCRLDGSGLEEIATGFWNPFGLTFDLEGRLFVTDNDPDSRGPNRLLEIVPGGDYGYKSLYGGSGIHPYQSWNGELPGTLPYAAPLGEAPCGTIDAKRTNFGAQYNATMLANIWEENNLVRIPLKSKYSSLGGEPNVLVQGDSLFHPVSFAANSKGELYFTDWMVRQYPNHGKGRIWRLRADASASLKAPEQKKPIRFQNDIRTTSELVESLRSVDPFERTIARYYLAKNAKTSELESLLKSRDPQLRLETLLVFFKRDSLLSKKELTPLLSDSNPQIIRMTLLYVGEKGIDEMLPELNTMLNNGTFPSELFDTILATIKHLQPEFIEKYSAKEGKSADIPRILPESYLQNLLADPKVNDLVKAMAVPYLKDIRSNENLLIQLLQNSKDETLQLNLINSLSESYTKASTEALKMVALSKSFGDMTRATALLELRYRPVEFANQLPALLEEESTVLNYATIKYVSHSGNDLKMEALITEWIESRKNSLPSTLISVWEQRNKTDNPKELTAQTNPKMDPKDASKIGNLVYKNKSSLCTTCHQINAKGGIIGPELTKIGSSKSKQQLIDAILNPSKEIAPEWQGWYVVDKNGVRHTGRQIDVHLNGVELMDVSGNFTAFDSPLSYGVMEKSIMPEGLENTMTALEFNHLITFLSSLK